MITATVITPQHAEHEYCDTADELGAMLLLYGFIETDRRGAMFRWRDRIVVVDDEHAAAKAAQFLESLR